MIANIVQSQSGTPDICATLRKGITPEINAIGTVMSWASLVLTSVSMLLVSGMERRLGAARAD